MHNDVQSALQGGSTIVGTTLMLGSSRAGELMGQAGFDFVMIDLQHGPFTKESATDAVRALTISRTTPFARVADNSFGAINDVLDSGALGVVVPMVGSREEATHAVAAAFYPPKGRRSKGASPTALYGDDYAALANDHVLLVVMIETSEAVERADEILSVPGIDMCLIGTSDLALDMGCERTGEPIQRAVKAIIAAGTRHGVAMGVAIGSVEDIKIWESLRPAFYLISHDHGLLKKAAFDLASAMKLATAR